MGIATWVICGFWDWFLYFSPLQAKLAKYKMNPQYPSFNQIKHDAMVTTSASCCGAAVEILLCHLWAVNKLPAFQPLSEAPVMNLMFALLVTHYRIPHFHAMHRAMHPWKTTSIPDLGKFLYRQVHALHHKSYNPTAFSGTNMHPVEATLYYSACARTGSDHRLRDGSLAWSRWLSVAWQWRLLPYAAPQALRLQLRCDACSP